MMGSIRRTAIAIGLALISLAVLLRTFGGLVNSRRNTRELKRQVEAHKDREEIEDDIAQDDDLVARAHRSGLVR